MGSIAATAAVAPSVAVSSPLASSDVPAAGGPRVAVLPVDTDRATTPIDRRIYGHFLEHINHSVEDGLFAEQIQGCGFEGEDFKTYWKSFSDRGKVEIADIEFQNGKKSVRLHVEGGRAGIRQGRLYVAAGYEYDGSTWVRREQGSPQLTLRVVSPGATRSPRYRSPSAGGDRVGSDQGGCVAGARGPGPTAGSKVRVGDESLKWIAESWRVYRD